VRSTGSRRQDSGKPSPSTHVDGFRVRRDELGHADAGVQHHPAPEPPLTATGSVPLTVPALGITVTLPPPGAWHGLTGAVGTVTRQFVLISASRSRLSSVVTRSSIDLPEWTSGITTSPDIVVPSHVQRPCERRTTCGISARVSEPAASDTVSECVCNSKARPPPATSS
jgi:hypothetical protein